jgi:hypothetical protein
LLKLISFNFHIDELSMTTFPKFKEKYGNTIDSKEASKESIERFTNVLPDSLIQLWKEDGWAGYADGLIWTIDPAKYKSILSKWVEIGADGVPFLRTAFGDIIFWDFEAQFGNIVNFIDVRHQEFDIICTEGIEYLFDNAICDENYFYDLIQAHNFSEALEKLGHLKSDECYGYEPILALGGDESIDNLKIVKFDVHLDILTQSVTEPID